VKKVKVDPGICGFPATIKVERASKDLVKVHIACGCDQVKRFGERVADLEWKRAFGPMCTTEVYKAASETLKHVTCPIPMALLKAVEAEIGAALPRDVTVRFIEDSDREEERPVED
jgi:hypothetical protein